MDKRDEDLSLLKSEFIDFEKDLKESGNDLFEEQKYHRIIDEKRI